MRMPVTIAEFLSGKQIAVPPRARAKVRIVAMVDTDANNSNRGLGPI